MRYLPTPFHTKYAQQRTALSQYIQQEAVGTRMRRWERPIHDFLAPYLRGAVARVTGEDVIPEEVQHRRDLDTLTGLGPFPALHIYPSRARAGDPPAQSTPLALTNNAPHRQPVAYRPLLQRIRFTGQTVMLRSRENDLMSQLANRTIYVKVGMKCGPVKGFMVSNRTWARSGLFLGSILGPAAARLPSPAAP